MIPRCEQSFGTPHGSAFTSRRLPARRTRRQPPPRRLPRPRITGLHRVLVREAKGAARLALRIRDARASTKGDRRLHRPLPPATALRTRLPNADRGAPHLARWTATTENS